MPYPTERLVEMVAPEHYDAEAVGAGGAAGSRLRRRAARCRRSTPIPADGDVTGELVYVNFGMPEDYEQLAKLGVDVKGKIVDRALRRQLARHQAEGRLRARRGRLHHLFGSARGRLLPGRRLSRRAVSPRAGRAARQRDGHADPSGRSADARLARRAGREARMDRNASPTILKIPVLPISYGDALPLLRSLKGPVAPEGVARRAADHLSRRRRARRRCT